MCKLWDRFVDEFKGKLPYVPLTRILEAFLEYATAKASEDVAMQRAKKILYRGE